MPIVRLDLSSLRALDYAASLGQPVLAVHISPGDNEAARFKSYLAAWGDHLPLEVVDSPFRAFVAPLACYMCAQRLEIMLAVILPELIVKHRWHQPLHNGTARRLRRVLRRQPGVAITTIPPSPADLTARCTGPHGRPAPGLLPERPADSPALIAVRFGLDGRGANRPRYALRRERQRHFSLRVRKWREATQTFGMATATSDKPVEALTDTRRTLFTGNGRLTR